MKGVTNSDKAIENNHPTLHLPSEVRSLLAPLSSVFWCSDPQIPLSLTLFPAAVFRGKKTVDYLATKKNFLFRVFFFVVSAGWKGVSSVDWQQLADCRRDNSKWMRCYSVPSGCVNRQLLSSFIWWKYCVFSQFGCPQVDKKSINAALTWLTCVPHCFPTFTGLFPLKMFTSQEKKKNQSHKK